MGGVEGIEWGTTEVIGAARGVTEVSEAGDEGAAQGLAVGSLVVAVRLPASIQEVV
jgi:hypothetical protein